MIDNIPTAPTFIWRDINVSSGECIFVVLGDGLLFGSAVAYAEGHFGGTLPAPYGDVWLYEFLVEYIDARSLVEAQTEFARIRAAIVGKKLSEEARAARAPRPREELVGALQDRIHPTSGRFLAARPIARQRKVSGAADSDE